MWTVRGGCEDHAVCVLGIPVARLFLKLGGGIFVYA